MASYAGGSGGKSSLGSSSLSSGLIILRGRFDKGSEILGMPVVDPR